MELRDQSETDSELEGEKNYLYTPVRFHVFKIHCVGTCKVGKTSIVKRFTTKKWEPSYPDRGIEYNTIETWVDKGSAYIHFKVVDCPD